MKGIKLSGVLVLACKLDPVWAADEITRMRGVFQAIAEEEISLAAKKKILNEVKKWKK